MATAALLSKVPPFPPAVARLLHLAGAGADAAGELTAMIQADPALAREVLARAGAGHPERIDSVSKAIAVLGHERVRRIATTVVAGTYALNLRGSTEYLLCWRHTLATAFLAGEVAWAFGEPEDRAYSAGLLHDIGRLGLLAGFPEEYSRLLRRANQEPVDALEQERVAFGIDHCEAGRQLAEAWNLPREMVVTAGRHHDQLELPDGALLYYAHLGCRMADALGYSAVMPRQHATIDDLRALLPPEAQSRFCQDVLALHDALEAEIEAYGGYPPEEMPPPVFDSPVAVTIALPVAAEQPPTQQQRWSTDLWIYLMSAIVALAAVVWFSLR